MHRLFYSGVLTTVDASYFVMNFQLFIVNALIDNLSLDNDVCKQGDKSFFVALIVIFSAPNKCILLVHNVNPQLLFYALIEVANSKIVSLE